MGHAGLTVREVLGHPVGDEYGAWRGRLVDLQLRPTPAGPDPVDLVLVDRHGELVVPCPGALGLHRDVLTAPIAASERIRGNPEPAEVRLRADLMDRRAVDLRHDRVVGVRDFRFAQTTGAPAVDAALVAPPRPSGGVEIAWVEWSSLVWLELLLVGRPDAGSLARIRELPAIRLDRILSQLAIHERELLVARLGVPD
jgi:hypothetical protein